MNKEKFQEMLKNKRLKSLYHTDDFILTKYQHVERLGHNELSGLLIGDVYIQTKIDGANLTVAYDGNDYVICSRNQVCYSNGEIKNKFNGAVEYVLQHEGIKQLAKKFILRGEWLVKHSINYSLWAFNHFYVFDIQKYEDLSYIPADAYIPTLQEMGIKFIPVYKKIKTPTLYDLTQMLEGPDEFGADQKEGIVVKRYDFVNQYGRTTWGKLVHEEFKIKNKMNFGITKKDPPELRFTEHVTENLVMKVIHKIKDEKGVSIKDMARILDTVWYDVFSEYLWDFVKKNKVSDFNFKTAYKLVLDKTRDIALNYFNKGEKNGKSK